MIIPAKNDGLSIVTVEPVQVMRRADAEKLIGAMAEQIGSLAEMLRVTNERMAAMEAAIRTLEKVTPQQAAEINRRIRERAEEICMEYRMTGFGVKIREDGTREGPGDVLADPAKLKAVAAAIRKDVRIMTGAKTAREIARVDFGTVRDAILGWDDYDAIQRIRKGR